VDGAAGRASEEGARGAAEQCAPQDGGGGCKASATVRLVCTGWMSRHDALVMRLLLRLFATDEGAGVLVRRFPAVASLDLKCYCFHALTDEGMRAVSTHEPAFTFIMQFTISKGRGLMRLPSSLPQPDCSCSERRLSGHAEVAGEAAGQLVGDRVQRARVRSCSNSSVKARVSREMSGVASSANTVSEIVSAYEKSPTPVPSPKDTGTKPI
jgi:hypothetical protein